MIEINLLPEGLKKKQERFKSVDLSSFHAQFKELPILNIIGGIFGVLILLQVMLFFIGVYSKTVLISTDKHYEKILPQIKEAKALKSEVDTINKKVKAIDELMVKRFSWSKKLNDLSDSITPGIWLTELTYDEKITERVLPAPVRPSKTKDQAIPPKPVIEKVLSRYLIISGTASSMGDEGTALVGKFIKSLKGNADFYFDFQEIELGSIKRDKVEDQEVMRFKISCFFKEIK